MVLQYFLKKERKKCCSNLKSCDINENKTFWKNMKPLLRDNYSQSSRINFVDQDKVILEDQELAKTFDIILKTL